MLDDTRIAPASLVSELTTSEKQLVAIARALSENSEIILFDEPTSSLNSADAALLHAQIRRLKARGVTVIYITHKLGEVFEIADRVSVVRDGRHVSTRKIADVSYDDLINDMLGHNPKKIFAPRKEREVGAPVALKIDDIHAPNVNGVSLEVRRGEIVALAGLPGAGAENVLKAIFGLEHCRSGRIVIGGASMDHPSPRRAIEAGVAYLPSNRLADGILPLMSVVVNIEATSQAMARGKSATRRQDALTSIGRLNVRTSDPSKTITSLSGGNQQKSLIARWLMMKPGLLLLDDPTRGIDIGSKAEIYHLLRRLADAGMTVVFTSSDSIELAGLAERIVIFREGRVVEDIQATDDYQMLDRKIAG
jgi:ABC-type sugar transport system ATPase subunit